MLTDAEIEYLRAHDVAVVNDDSMALIRRLVGDVNKRPVMWLLENPMKHEYGHTTYPAVADAYRVRPGYTVTAIYPRAGVV